MNLKSLSALIAVVGVFTMIQAADAKHNNWNSNGQNTSATTGGYCGVDNAYGQRTGWNKNDRNFNRQLGQYNNNNAWQNGNRNNPYNNNNAWQNGNRNNQFNNNNPWQNGNRNNSNGRPWQFNNANVDQTQARLASRIQSGVASGRLTPQEAQRLNQMQARIDQMEVQFRSDNRLNTGERARLSSELSRLQNRLGKELRDRQTF